MIEVLPKEAIHGIDGGVDTFKSLPLNEGKIIILIFSRAATHVTMFITIKWRQ